MNLPWYQVIAADTLGSVVAIVIVMIVGRWFGYGWRRL